MLSTYTTSKTRCKSPWCNWYIDYEQEGLNLTKELEEQKSISNNLLNLIIKISGRFNVQIVHGFFCSFSNLHEDFLKGGNRHSKTGYSILVHLIWKRIQKGKFMKTIPVVLTGHCNRFGCSVTTMSVKPFSLGWQKQANICGLIFLRV